MIVKTSITKTTDHVITPSHIVYVAPELHIITIEVEQGVAASTDPWDREEL